VLADEAGLLNFLESTFVLLRPVQLLAGLRLEVLDHELLVPVELLEELEVLPLSIVTLTNQEGILLLESSSSKFIVYPFAFRPSFKRFLAILAMVLAMLLT
jgi:hypothetical protein